MMRTAIAMLALLCIALPGAAGDKVKEEKPKLSLRPSPRQGFSPLNVTFTLQLKGGDDLEKYYCPEVEWEWGDGGKSVREGEGLTESGQPALRPDRRHGDRAARTGRPYPPLLVSRLRGSLTVEMRHGGWGSGSLCKGICETGH